MEHQRLSWKLATPTVLLYAAGFPIGAATVQVMSPLMVILLRFALSTIVLWLILGARRVPCPSRRTVLHASVVGLMTQGVHFVALYWAFTQGVPSGFASLIIALNPIATAVMLGLFLGHRESKGGAAALILGLAAVVTACLPKILQDPAVGPALGAVVIAMLALAGGSIYQNRTLPGVDGVTVTAIGITASIPFAGIAALLTPVEVEDWAKAMTLLVLMVAVNSVGAMTLYAVCIKRFGARATSILFAIIPAVASVMAWIALGEDLSPFTIAGLVLGAAACVVQVRSGTRP